MAEPLKTITEQVEIASLELRCMIAYPTGDGSIRADGQYVLLASDGQVYGDVRSVPITLTDEQLAVLTDFWQLTYAAALAQEKA